MTDDTGLYVNDHACLMPSGCGVTGFYCSNHPESDKTPRPAEPRTAAVRLAQAVHDHFDRTAIPVSMLRATEHAMLDALAQYEIEAQAASPGSEYGGCIAVIEQAKEQGWPIHVATRTTCAEHLEKGDDKAGEFAFGQAASPDSEALRAALERIKAALHGWKLLMGYEVYDPIPGSSGETQHRELVGKMIWWASASTYNEESSYPIIESHERQPDLASALDGLSARLEARAALTPEAKP
jgi:hypothetical protein